MNPGRARTLSPGEPGRGPVIYWMHRDHRARDNWALVHAAGLARDLERGFVAAHCLDPAYPAARARHFRFLLDGLAETEEDLRALGVPLARLLGDPPARVARLARDLDAAAVVADFDPLRRKREWMRRAGEALPCPLVEVDARNVVPCFAASDKYEYMARTLRPRIHRLLPEFLEEFPEPPRQTGQVPDIPGDMPGAEAGRAIPGLAGAAPYPLFAPGGRAARLALDRFLEKRLAGYATRRNDPSLDGQSGLSPWLHFGMLSAQRVALAVAASDAPDEDRQAFLEELIVRRELADNFCLHRPGYDSPACYPDWARASHARHAADPRPALYAEAELEAGKTIDPAWNAAQREMLATGKMHGYMRMYWGKRLLEWTPSVEQAHALAVRLHDAHSLDGRDPNGYAGIAWCLGGVHDRPWGERPVFGLVRSMTPAGLKRKFDVDAYIARVAALEEGFQRA